MSIVQWLFEVFLSVLLALTLFHASRLQRALTALRHDRASLEEAITRFDLNAQQTQVAIDAMRASTDVAIRQVAGVVEQAVVMKDDLTYLVGRGDRLVDQISRCVSQDTDRPRSVGLSSWASGNMVTAPSFGFPGTGASVHEETEGRPRSKAEQDLLRALQSSR